MTVPDPAVYCYALTHDPAKRCQVTSSGDPQSIYTCPDCGQVYTVTKGE